jgi:peptidylprolyl isomerase
MADLLQVANLCRLPPPMRRRSLALTLILAIAAPAVAGCGGDDESTTTSPAPPRHTDTTEHSPAALAEALKDTSAKPVIPKPTGSPPRTLVKDDIVKGKGRPAKLGDTVSVQYEGVTFSTSEQFDASWDRGQPFTFVLGAGKVIPGWDRGVVGMRTGGRRMLTIPPELAYGTSGSPPLIGPNETLVFVVDLKAVKRS